MTHEAPLNWKRTFFPVWIGQAFSLLGSELVQFSLSRDLDSIDDFIELIEALNNNGAEQGAQRLTAFVCNSQPQHELCSMPPTQH